MIARLVMMGMLASTLASCSMQHPLLSEDWQQYQKRFISSDGRVHDTANDWNTHSEAQGFGMLLAEAFGDRKQFDSIWRWTQSHLQKRQGDSLLAWNWSEKDGAISDFNNASDGDILVAWALLRAARRWHDDNLRRQAHDILDSIRSILIRNHGRYLLPGAYGFESREALRLNLSYYIFPAFRDFIREFPEQRDWQQLYDSGLELIDRARFGKWKLPADWVLLQRERLLPYGTPPYFSFDAIRIPLYLAWAGERSRLDRFISFWSRFNWNGDGPERLNLANDRIMLGRQAIGAYAIYALCRNLSEMPMPLPTVDWASKPHYYETSLVLLSRIAANEANP